MKKETRTQLLWALLGMLAMLAAFVLTNRERGRLELGGIYEGQKLSATITQVQPNEYRADLTSTDRRCKTEVTAYGQRIENFITFTPQGAGEQGKDCRFGVKWSPDGQRLVFEEEKCEGVYKNCRFEGSLRRVSKFAREPEPETDKKKQ